MTPEMMQQMMAAIHKQNENMTTMMRQQVDAFSHIASTMPRGGLTDTRGFGRPIGFNGEESKYREWKVKLYAFVLANNQQGEEWMEWASQQGTPITAITIKDKYDSNHAQVEHFARGLWATIVSCTSGSAFDLCHSAGQHNGLEALRLITRRFEPRTPATKRALLKAVINNPACKKVDEIERNMLHVEELMRKYAHMAGAELPEDLKVTVIIDLCPKDLKEHLELITREMPYKEVRDEIASYVERKRDLFGLQVKDMEIDSAERKEHWSWWGGDGYDDPRNHEHLCQYEYEDQYLDMDYIQIKGGKKGSKGSAWKGGPKGQSKGKGHFEKGRGGDKGKGKGGGFQGHCHWCGEWGHSQSRCRWKDEYMRNIRQGKGPEVMGESRTFTNNMETAVSEEKTAIENLEARRPVADWNPLCSLEENRYAVLAEDQLDVNDTPGEDFHELSDCISEMTGVVNNDSHQKPNGVKRHDGDWTLVRRRKTMAKCPNHAALNGAAIAELNVLSATGHDSDDGHMWITIDSGASENVISPTLAPQFPTRPSQGSQMGLKYVAANGSLMPNRGEKEVRVLTEEGTRCMLKMQVTDVHKPLMSVARICDAGHQVTFTKDGGHIMNNKTGQVTGFSRVDNVYRLKVGLAPPAEVFSRQGC